MESLSSQRVLSSTKNASEHGTTSQDQSLFCLCNDNVECASKLIPETLWHKESFPHLGYCSTNTDGRCYTARDVDVVAAQLARVKRHSISSVENEGYFDFHNDSEFDIGKFIHVRYGCLSSPSKITFSCNGHLAKHLIPKTIACCNSSNYCNARLFPEFIHHSSDIDALKSALENQQYIIRSPQHRPLINRELNVGPSLLSGGELVFDSHIRKPLLSDASNSNLLQIFNIVLVVSFSSVIVILLLLLVSMYICYKRRLRKRKYKICESLLWYSAVSSNGEVGCLPASVTNSWMSENKKRNTNGLVTYSKGNKQKDQSVPSACSSQTMSSHLTRTADSCNDVRPSQSLRSQVPHNMLRTIGRQVTLERFVGRGRFSDVWIGTWRGDQVAAKVFNSNHRITQIIWKRTASVHRSVLIRHHAIQGLMAVDWIYYPSQSHQAAFKDQINVAPSLRAMLISEVHQWGTLKDLMTHYRWRYFVTTSNSCESWPQEPVQLVHTLTSIDKRIGNPILTTTDELFLSMILKMAMSLARGLCFLHSELVGTRGKPALAHRDLKPSNIFVRSDWTLCIGDIGFCVRPPPNPLPLPLSELNQLYSQYSFQLQRHQSLSKRLVPSNSADKEQLCSDGPRSVNTILHEQRPVNPSFENPSNQNQATSGKFVLDRAELLDWWPAGGMQIGTPRYMAPELLNHTAAPFSFEGHQKADIYAISLVLWELLTWALPRPIFHSCDLDFESEWPPGACRLCTPGKRSQPGPLSCSSSCPEPAYIPAYQSEVDAWFRDNLPSFEGDVQSKNSGQLTCSIDGIPSEQAAFKEPDLSTMRHLVCDLNERPGFPFAIDYAQCNMSVETVRVEQSDPCARPSQSNSESFRCVDISQTADIIGKPIVVESSSSGASSLNGTQTVSNTTAHSDTSRSAGLRQLHHTIVHQFTKLLPECWTADPNSRLTALRIRKTLQRMIDQLDGYREQCRALTCTAADLDESHPLLDGVFVQSSDSSTVRAES